MSREYLQIPENPSVVGNRCLFTEEMIIGRERYLGWPVDAYRIFVPVLKDDPLGGKFNPFERIIIAQLSVEDPLVNSDTALADHICLPQDFVHDILLKLEGAGIVQEGEYRLNEKIKAVILDSEDKAKEDAPEEMLTGFVFRDAVTGRILPHIMIVKDGNLETMDYDEVSKRSPIILERNPQVSHAPTDDEVRSAIIGWRHRVRDDGNSPKIPSYVKFEKLDAAESYYLLCPIAVRRSDGADRIGDPFGLGYSLVLEAAFEDAKDNDPKLLNKMEDWMRSLENKDEKIREALNKIKLPFDVDRVESAYPRLASVLETIYGSSSPSFPDLFSALEWGFHYHFADDVESIYLALTSMTTEEFADKVKETLVKLGWEGCHLPSKWPYEKQITAFSKGECALFKVLFPIMLMRETTPGTALFRIHDEIPDFPKVISALRRLRGAKSHGAKVEYDMLLSYSETRDFVEHVLTILLPDLAFTESTPEAVLIDAKTDNRFKARNDVRMGYGRKICRGLPSETVEHLVEAQIEFNTLQEDGNAAKLIREVASPMQSLLTSVLNDVPRKRDRNPFVTAKNRLRTFQFDPLSDAFKELNPDRVSRGLDWNVETLGVAGLVLATCGSDELLRQIALRDAGFFNFIGEVHLCRGHDQQIVLSVDERRSLQIHLKRFIEILMEVGYGQEE